jgi:hypothetical protein
MSDWQLSDGSLFLPLVWGEAPARASVGALADDVKKSYAALAKREAQHSASASILDNDSIPSSAAMPPQGRFTQAATRWRLAAEDAGSEAALSAKYPSLHLEQGSSAAARQQNYLAFAAADDQKALAASGGAAPSPGQTSTAAAADLAGGIGFTALFLGIGYLGWLLLARRHA